MESVASGANPYARAEQALGRIEGRLDPAYDVVKLGRMSLGDAPVSFASTAVGATLRLLAGPDVSERGSKAIGHAGLAADGLFRGLLYTGGLLHGAAAAKVPWLVVPRAAPAGFAGIAGTLSKVATFGRLALLGIGGALGALRSANAIAKAGSFDALLNTRDGRGGALQAVGSVLLMVKHPLTMLAGAGVFGLAIANEFM